MDIETELKAIRYLINDLILYVYDLRTKLETISPTKEKSYKEIPEPNRNGDDVAFDLFSIPKGRYKELIEMYGEDIVVNACAKLDNFVKLNNYIPYRTGYNSLKQRFIKEVLFEREQERKKEIKEQKHLEGL